MTCIIYMAGLFEDGDIVHAKETIHYLISKQGDKATHFQVISAVIQAFEKSLEKRLCQNPWPILREGKTQSLSFKPEFGTC